MGDLVYEENKTAVHTMLTIVKTSSSTKIVPTDYNLKKTYKFYIGMQTGPSLVLVWSKLKTLIIGCNEPLGNTYGNTSEAPTYLAKTSSDATFKFPIFTLVNSANPDCVIKDY